MASPRGQAVYLQQAPQSTTSLFCPESLHQGGRKASHAWDGRTGRCLGTGALCWHWALPVPAPQMLRGQQDSLDRRPWQGNKARCSAASSKPPRSRFLALVVCTLTGNRAEETGSAAEVDSCSLLQAEGQSSHWDPAQPISDQLLQIPEPAEPSGAQAPLRGRWHWGLLHDGHAGKPSRAGCKGAVRGRR